MFWIIALVIALLAVLPMALSMIRARGIWSVSQTNADVEMRVYRDQLAEVERDLARGVLSEEDAARTRTEVSRRLLEADKAREKGERRTARPSMMVGLVVSIACLGGAFALYLELGAAGYPDLPLSTRIANAAELRENRMSQLEAEEQAPPRPPMRTPTEEHAELMEKLRNALVDRPDDLQGHALLARNEAIVGNYRAAYEAQQRVIEIKGDAATAQDYADLADMMILAANGFVSPEAETALTRALSRDDQNTTALYYSGLLFAQTGRPDLAFRIWEPLLANAPADAPYVLPIRARIETLAQAAGVRYTLPPEGGNQTRGPSAEDIENAANMSVEDRMEMIEGMVDSLSARLANEGGTPQEWAQLIRALGVLGETGRANAIWQESQVMFGADPQAMALLRTAATDAGIIN